MEENAGEKKVKFATSTKDVRQMPKRYRSSMQVTKDGVNFGIPSRMSVQAFASNTFGDDSWKTNALHFIHQKSVQIILMTLLCLDILIIFIELFLMSEYPSCHLIERDCIACCSGGDDDAKQNRRWLSEGGDDVHEDICQAGYDQTGEAGCDRHKWQTVHTIEEVLFYLTVSILVIFMVENLVEMAALGVRTFFKQIFLAADFFVVLISLVLELVFHLMHSQLAEIASLLVLFRIWRFVRIGHGIIEVTSELTHEHYNPLMEYARECEEKFKKSGITPPEKSEEVEQLMTSEHD